ncbi:MAG: alanine--tRNA ligase [Rhodospirillales bacterium]|jgi:alanyl-tRNA synthetase|nr:alanine--tRNA ligase [Rhodospirillales bacterium]
MTATNDVRQTFLDYFRQNGHEVVASSPLVPRNDPTLMFANSGMVQFKNVFTGAEKRTYTRAATSQKCVRAGGKHNDLENVGHTARHHTFFEMLGNFSFGDYFKDVAIELAWNLVTKEFGLPPEHLLVTVFADDDEAHAHWRKIAGLPDDRVLRIATADNFWSMGETGPCGPCSEIFYDHGAGVPGGPPGSPDAEGDRFIEIWNLVFMQFEQLGPDERAELPRPSIDTGMGLERIAAVLQGTHDNYAIDIFADLIEASAHATGTETGGPHAVSHRVIADHVRASGFLIADGVLPSNEGRGYVLRRIMRRAMRHVQMIGVAEPVLWRLVPNLVNAMGGAYPELRHAEALITETLKLEESRFLEMLARGLRLLDVATADSAPGTDLPGEVAFKLYDTYGFPLDLTQDALKAKNMGVDVDAFDVAMAKRRADARKSWTGSGEEATEAVWFDVRESVGATEFLGYQTETAEAKITAILKGSERVDEAGAGDEVAIVVNQTPFYAESGGQMGDAGSIIGTGTGAIVLDTHNRAGDVHAHAAKIESGVMRVGDDVRMIVDGPRRARLRANHSATHLLHAALRSRLGDHVVQKGSLVAPDRLRFDISHLKAVTAEELVAVEADVNAQIRRNAEVATHLMDADEAVGAGALALFGEKYDDEVRVVSMGVLAEGAYSTELCGGTHVARTGNIGVFKVVAESAVAAGVRRIEALTGDAALAHLGRADQALREIADLLNVSAAEAPERIAALIDERRRLERELAEARRRLATGGGAEAVQIKDIKGIKFSPRVLDGMPPKDLKGLADDVKSRLGSGVVALVTVNEGRASLVVGVTDDLTDRLDAVELVRAGSIALGGKGGGGRADMAQAGGPEGAKAASALKAIEAALAEAV